MKYIKTYESFLFEAKEVGDLYHFTDMNGLLGILKEDRMKSIFEYISFSRNPLLHDSKEYSRRNVRITFDGDEMSNKFKIEPFMFGLSIFGNTEEIEKTRRTTWGEEREERILGHEIKGIKKYITRVEIIKGHEKKFDERLEKENPGIEFDIADSFKTHHKSLMVA